MLKKLLVAGATLAILGGIGGCEDAAKTLKHFKSGAVGLKRVVTFYAPDGTVKKWSGKFKVEVTGGTASFITDDGKEVKVSGFYTIEEM